MSCTSRGVVSFNQRISPGLGTPSVMLQVKVTLSPSVIGLCGPDRVTSGGTSGSKRKKKQEEKKEINQKSPIQCIL